MRVTPPPLFTTQFSLVFQTLRSTQRVNTRYAKILLYRTQAVINFYFKKDQFSSRNTANVTYKEHYSTSFARSLRTSFARSLRSRFLGVISAFINLNIDLGGPKLGNITSKHIKANAYKNYYIHVHATDCHFIFFI